MEEKMEEKKNERMVMGREMENETKYSKQDIFQESKVLYVDKCGHLQKIITCEKCGKVFKHKKTLKRHKKLLPFCDQMVLINSGKFCHDMIDLSKRIKSDQQIKIGGKSTTITKCDICKYNFSSGDKMQIHQEEFNSKLQCCLCDKYLGNRHKLKNHHRTHTKEKPFECQLCEKKFSECSSLRKHVLTHTNKTFECHTCAKRFARKDYLLKQVQSNVCFMEKI